MIENYRPDPEHNPTKLLPRGVKVWYADPCCSSQKPHIERFHLDLRRILQKGTSFNMLDQNGVNSAFSPVYFQNSSLVLEATRFFRHRIGRFSGRNSCSLAVSST